MSMGSTSFAEEKLSFEQVPVEVIEGAIQDFTVVAPNHKMNKDLQLLREYANGILDASKSANVPWWAVTTLAACESSFKTNALGKAGEVGILQLNGKGPWKRCAELEKRVVDKDSIADQLICGAHWFRESYENCGTLKGANSSYLSGSVCSAKPESSLGQQAKNRTRMMLEMKSKGSKRLDEIKGSK
jgi:hypothetical protein